MGPPFASKNTCIVIIKYTWNAECRMPYGTHVKKTNSVSETEKQSPIRYVMSNILCICGVHSGTVGHILHVLLHNGIIYKMVGPQF